MSEARNILLVHPGATLGGGALAVMQAAELLRASGHRPLLVFNAPGPAATAAAERGLDAVTCPIPRWFCGFEGGPRGLDPRLAFQFFRDYARSVRALSHLIRDRAIELVYINTSPALTALVAARRAGVPAVLHVRETLNRHSAFGRAHIRFIERYADIIVPCSDYTASVFTRRDNVIRLLDGLPDRARDFSPAEIAAMRAAWGAQPGQPVVALVGAVNTIKGHFLFMRAIPGIHRRVPNARFVFIGSKIPASYHASLRGKLRKLLTREEIDADALLATLGVSDLAHFTGWISDVPLALAAANVVVFPSIIAEGTGWPPIEAGMLGKPVVVFDIGPLRESVQHEATGLVVPPRDLPALEDAVVRLLEHPDLVRSLGSRAREFTTQKFSETRYHADLNALFARALTLCSAQRAPQPAPGTLQSLRELLGGGATA